MEFPVPVIPRLRIETWRTHDQYLREGKVYT
jgi:hypothetical protein